MEHAPGGARIWIYFRRRNHLRKRFDSHDHCWHREQDETQEDFKQRVMAGAPKGSGQSFTVVIFWTVDNQGIAD
jgi:hypothetical protein